MLTLFSLAYCTRVDVEKVLGYVIFHMNDAHARMSDTLYVSVELSR